MKKVTVIGLGPGGGADLTGRARAALEGCDLIVGYTAYIERLARPNSRQGCGYGVRVIGPLEGALRLFASAGIPVAEVQEGER